MRRELAELGAVLACVGATAWLRLTGWAGAVLDQDVVERSIDAAFHARRMIRTVASWPHVPAFDPLLDWPNGGYAPWPAGFDLIGATLALPAAGDPLLVQLTIACLPVILGVLLVLGTCFAFRVVMPSAPWWSGWTAAGIVGVLPQSVSTSRFANPDHHIAEALVMLALGTWSVASCRQLLVGPSSPGSRLRAEGIIAAITCIALNVFVGSPVYVATAAVPVMITNLAASRAGRWGTFGLGGPGMLAGALLAAGLQSDLVHAHGHTFSYVYPSLLQPLLVAGAGLGCLLAATLGRVLARPHGWLWATTGLVVALVVGGWAALSSPAGRELAHGMEEWFGGNNALLTNTTENHPLLSGPPWSAAAWAQIYRLYGPFGVLAPLSLPVACALLVRQEGRAALAFVFWTTVVTLLALNQSRFGRVALINLALATTVVLAWAGAHLRRGALLGWAPVAALLLDPATRFYIDPPTGIAPAAEAAIALRRATTEVPQRLGVFAPWDIAHRFLRHSGRGAPGNGFGFYVGPEAYTRETAILPGREADLLQWMEERQLGYAVLGADEYETMHWEGAGAFTADTSGPRQLRPDYLRTFPLAASVIGGSGLAAERVPHLEHLLPIVATQAGVVGVPLPRLWVYERVAGARLIGSSTPGDRILARVGLRVRGHTMPYEAWTTTGEDGVFVLVIALPSAWVAEGIETSPEWALQSALGGAHLPIPIQAVRAGTEIPISFSDVVR